jgi:hypothetical protein
MFKFESVNVRSLADSRPIEYLSFVIKAAANQHEADDIWFKYQRCLGLQAAGVPM